MAANRTHLLHVFATFLPAGPQVRTAQLMNAMGDAYCHSVVAMDGQTGAADLVDTASVDLTLLDAPPIAGSWATVRACKALLANHPHDLLLTYNWGAIDAVMAAKSLGAAPVLHHEDGFRPDEVQRTKGRRDWFRRRVLPSTAGLVVPSENLRSIACARWGLTEDQVTFIPNGIDLDAFGPGNGNAELRAQLGIPGDAVVLGAVGHLREVKNVSRLLGALARVLLRHENVHLLLLGDGPQRQMLAERAAESPLGGHVHFAGHQSPLGPWYGAMDAFAISSDSEQMPIALIEAMASGLPVASTDVGDVRLVLPEPQHTLLVPVRAGTTAERLAIALGRLATSPELRSTLGEANRERVAEHYTLGGMVTAHRAQWDSAVGTFAATT